MIVRAALKFRESKLHDQCLPTKVAIKPYFKCIRFLVVTTNALYFISKVLIRILSISFSEIKDMKY